jgi:hypothetical protein
VYAVLTVSAFAATAWVVVNAPFTVRLAVPVTPSTLAATVLVPAPTGVAVVVTPVAGLTVAVPGVPLTQLNVFPLITVLFASRADPVNTCPGPPTVRVAALGVTTTAAVACATVRLAVPLMPSTLAVIVLVPFATAVAVVAAPLAGLTVAVPGVPLAQLNVFPLSRFACASRASAAKTCVAPTAASVTGLGVTATTAVTPGVTMTPAVCVIPTPFTVTETVLASATVELRMPVATPLTFVVADGCARVLPVPVAARTTDAPTIGFPAASLAVTVMVEDTPSAEIEAGAATTVESTAETEPETTVTVGSALVTATPPTVAPIVVAVPAASPVKTAVYVPFPTSVVTPMDPVLVPPDAEKETFDPPAVRLLPNWSFA